ncbi:MAG: hypothetical protein MI757_17800, partial [Pirellulales bacterium]|nr:hypothetical protein [Pirellulales bacterium]
MDRLDAKLAALVEEKPPEKLSTVEVESLVSQLERSKVLREKLLSDRQFDSYFEIVLGRSGLSRDDFNAHVARQIARRKSPTIALSLLIGAIVFVIGAFAGHRISGWLADRGDDQPKTR